MKGMQLLSLLLFIVAATRCSDSGPVAAGPEDDNSNDPAEQVDDENFSPALNLGSLPSATIMEPWAISDRGEIVGRAIAAGRERAFYYVDGAIKDLGDGVATDISDTGRIVGAKGAPAVVWEKSGQSWRQVDLPGEPNAGLRKSGAARGINRAGNRIVGRLTLEDQTTAVSKAVLWSEESGQWTVTVLPSSEYVATAEDLNERFIVGWSQRSEGFDLIDKAVAWSHDGSQWTLHDLPLPPATISSQALAINNHGEIVGRIINSSGRSRSVCWIPSISPGAVSWNHPLIVGDLPGWNSLPHDINDVSEIVGVLFLSDEKRHGFLWTPAAATKDLGGIAGGSSTANAINATGDIAGSGRVFTRLIMWASGAPQG